MAALLWAAPLLSQPVEINLSEGHIDDKVAVSFWPSQSPDSENPLNPHGFEVHLVPALDYNKELVFPCGQWIQPPPGKYKFWLEGNGLVSPFSNAMVFSGGPFTGKGGASVSSVVPGGLVGIPQEATLDSSLTLRLLHVAGQKDSGHLTREFSRRVKGPTAYDGVIMPEGEVVTTLYDDVEGEYVGITRPFAVYQGRTARVFPEPPKDGTDILLILERPTLVHTSEEDDVELVLRGDNTQVAPHVQASHVDRIYAIWYDQQEPYLTLEVESQSVQLERLEVPLRPSKVEVVRASLKRLPNLDVHIDVPGELMGEMVTLELIASPHGTRTTLDKITLDWETKEHRFSRVPAGQVEVMLTAGLWSARQSVDLGDGQDQTLYLRLDPISVEGRVYRGENTHPGNLRFRTSRVRPTDELLVTTDETGFYKSTLFRPGPYIVFVELEGRRGIPFMERVEIPSSGAAALDFRIPANAYRVKVLDATSGEGIEGAQVHADNILESGETISQPTVTDSDGLASLQPLRAGQLILDVRASGYKYPGKIKQPVPEVKQGDFVVMLHPAGSGAELRLLLTGGTPAVDAEIRAQASLGNAAPLWQGKSDGEGGVEVPKYLDGMLLLVRHHASAFLVRRWPGGDSEASWILPSNGTSLILQVAEAWEEPVPWARIAIDVDGWVLSGTTLSWLARSLVGAANADGSWHGAGFPRSSIRIMAWSDTIPGLGLENVFDALASTVTYPWPAVVEVQVSR